MTANLERAPVTLDARTVDAIAERVAELLRDEHAAAGMVDAAEIARRFNVSRDFVYDNADRLGAVRLGEGPKARLRFDPIKVAEALTPRPHPVTGPRPHTRPRRRSPDRGVELLPIGRKAA